ncbi:MAG TPA: hypothetical protein VGG48_05590 [Rhizomicrobium sp.]
MSLLREKLGLPGNKLIRERLRALTAAPHPRPLFVFGNQKSGTTAVAGLLAAATGTPVTLDFAGAAEPFIGRLFRGDTSTTDFVRRNAWAFSTGIVKEPSLTFAAPQMMAHFGVTRAVFVIRDPYDNIRSILDRLKLRGDLASLDPESIKANRTWRSLVAGHDLGLPPDHYITTLARRWLRAAEILQAGAAQFETVRYDDFNADRVGTIAALARKLELDPRHDIAALATRDFQRRGRPRAPSEFFGDNLSRIDGICGAAAQALGFQSTH